ncbi:MAG: FAD:protein FMN transferase [Ectothiorhodospiraceae bacterium]|nr:FAD:protein FMN transferase [Ectothiorhodospiraceae bacterium]
MIDAFFRLILLFAVVFLTACSPKPTVHHEQLLVFGTVVDIKLWGVEAPEAQRLITQLAEDFEYMHRSWHAWHAGPLGRVNALLLEGKTFTAVPSIMPLVERSSELSLLSGGLFNPAIGKLIALWGFASDKPPKGPPPSDVAIRAILEQRPSMSDVYLEGLQMRGKNPALKLDFGAFAKGYAVDRAIEFLQEAGIKNAVVNAGGDLRAIGRHGERPWRIGIRHPRQAGILASVEVEGDESVFTSGDYERYFDWEGKRYDHIIDPRTGYPAKGLSSVTVFAQQADLADAAATALFVAGPKEEDWLPVARAMGITGVMLVDEEGGIQITPSIQERLYFEPGPESGSEATAPSGIRVSQPLMIKPVNVNPVNVKPPNVNPPMSTPVGKSADSQTL